MIKVKIIMKGFITKKNIRVKNAEKEAKWCKCGNFIKIPRGFVLEWEPSFVHKDSYIGWIDCNESYVDKEKVFLKEWSKKRNYNIHLIIGRKNTLLRDKRFFYENSKS